MGTDGVRGKSGSGSLPSNPGPIGEPGGEAFKLIALMERNGQLLDKYRPHLPESLLTKFDLLTARHQQNLRDARPLQQYPDAAHRQDLYDRSQILQRRILDLGREQGEALEGQSKSPPKLADISEPQILRPPIPPPRLKPAPRPGPPPGGGSNEKRGIPLETPQWVLAETLQQLHTVLAQRYQNNRDEMAFDLGLEAEELRRILSGEGSLQAQLNLARRLGTLLYLERERFVDPYFSDLRGSPGNEKYLAVEALKAGLEVYLQKEQLPWGQDLSLPIDTGVQEQTNRIKSMTIVNLFRGRFLSQGLPPLAQGLIDYLQESHPEIRERIVQGMNQVYGGRLEWDKRLAALKGVRWKELAALNPEVSRSLQEGEPIYLVGSSMTTLYADGRFNGRLSLAAAAPRGSIPFVQLEKRKGKLVVTESGGGYHQLLAQALRQAGLAGWSKEYAAKYDLKPLERALSECRRLQDLPALARSEPLFLAKLVQERWGAAAAAKTFYLAGSSMNTLLADGRIVGRLSLAEAVPGGRLPFVQLETRKGRLVVTESGGNNDHLLAQALRQAGLVKFAPEYKPRTLKKHQAGFFEIPFFSADSPPRKQLPRDIQLTQRFLSQSAVGALPFAVGEYVSNPLTGHPSPTLKEFAELYVPLSLIGGASQTSVDGLIRLSEGKGFLPTSPFVTEASGSLGKALTRRTLPLFMTFTLLDVVKKGEVDWETLPVTVGNILAASTATHALGSSLNKIKFVSRVAKGLHLIKAGSLLAAPESGGATLLGACLASVVEFTLLKLLGNAEQWASEYLHEQGLRRAYAEVIQRNNDLLAQAQAGEAVNPAEILEAQQGLFALQTAYQNFLQGKIDRWTEEWRAQRRILELEEMEQLTRILDGSWSRGEIRERYSQLRKRLRKEYATKIAELEGEAAPHEESWPLQNPGPALADFEIHKAVAHYPYTPKPLTEENVTHQIQAKLSQTLHGLGRQYENYLAATNAKWGGVLEEILLAETDEE